MASTVCSMSLTASSPPMKAEYPEVSSRIRLTSTSPDRSSAVFAGQRSNPSTSCLLQDRPVRRDRDSDARAVLSDWPRCSCKSPMTTLLTLTPFCFAPLADRSFHRGGKISQCHGFHRTSICITCMHQRDAILTAPSGGVNRGNETARRRVTVENPAPAPRPTRCGSWNWKGCRFQIPAKKPQQRFSTTNSESERRAQVHIVIPPEGVGTFESEWNGGTSLKEGGVPMKGCKWTAEQKLAIVLGGITATTIVSEICREHESSLSDPFLCSVLSRPLHRPQGESPS
ncbi:MAG: hypothetical protein KatS3mg082_2607 [Nitrospiraceae bacterium]|nr:MAG: hypothetical protein KatS3mg082_2607 [Nitrospiraceae bacterium]